MRTKANRRWGTAAMAVCLLAALALPAHAVTLDGVVSNIEWANHPKTDLIRLHEQSFCGIQDAVLRHEIGLGQAKVTFGCVAHAAGVQADSPIGAVLLANGTEIGRWQQGVGANCDRENYSLRGAASLAENANDGSYNFELELG
ncbi:MAG: hypothetical protein LBB50_04465, partial [Oscillospiraceae bacterium]|nr:hypothetical protein [Oscillospiraceae bacterium]